MLGFNRSVLCSWRRCRRVLEEWEQRLTLKYFEGRRCITALCPYHYDLLDKVGRIRFWRRHRRPGIKGARVGSHNVDAFYMPKPNMITVTEHFAHAEPQYQVYVLSHETIHWILAREFGLLTSMSFDVFYKQPLRVLGGHSLHTWGLNSLYEATEALNTAVAL